MTFLIYQVNKVLKTAITGAEASVKRDFLYCWWMYKLIFNKQKRGWALWLKPVIPALWEAEAGGSLQTRSWRPPWATWQNPVSTKNTEIS